jgi:hypothetical protein
MYYIDMAYSPILIKEKENKQRIKNPKYKQPTIYGTRNIRLEAYNSNNKLQRVRTKMLSANRNIHI